MKKITEAMSAALGAVCSFFTGLSPVIWVLGAVMSLDYKPGACPAARPLRVCSKRC